jgi:FtsP/CotA-like multicopper oxidase with cupredoxin domain
MPGMDHGGMKMDSMPGMDSPVNGKHRPDTHGPSNQMVAMVQRNRLGEPGTGLEKAGHRVLVYNDLKALEPSIDPRPAEREIEMHLTGNMERQMWGIDGKKYSEVREPIPLRLGERVKVTLVNDTMMDHPMHLHGMWMVLDNGAGPHMPYKHTINVKAGECLSFIVTPDERGPFAFHCHLLFHMELGMLRVVSVTQEAEKPRP